jgi:hypothetical protein
VLFSKTKFWEDHGNAWPQHITIVSHEFKRERLVDNHCVALGYPLERVSFVGVDPPGIDETNEPAMKGVLQAVAEWKENSHGIGGTLADKRKKRNPWNVFQGLFSSHEDRKRSGVQTMLVGDEYVLNPSAVQPWSSGQFRTNAMD